MRSIISDFTIIRVGIALSMLGIVSFLDIKYREIHDYWWIVFGAIAGILLIFEPDFDTNLLDTGIALIIAPIVLVMWRFGLFGGADAFGFIVLSALFPLGSLTDATISPFTTITNTVIVAALATLYNLGRNLISLANHEDIFEGIDETKAKKILAIFIGYKSKNPKFGFSIESQHGKVKKIDLSLHHAEDAEFSLKPNSWVTPGLPYFIFITIGFLIQIFYGDMILKLFNLA